jgi:hypothetical protein
MIGFGTRYGKSGDGGRKVSYHQRFHQVHMKTELAT